MVWIAFDEDCPEAEIAAKLYVGEGVADDQAGGWFNFGELGLRLFEEARQRLAAVALVLVMGAKIKAVDVCFRFCQKGLKLGMDVLDIGSGVEAEGDAALVGDNENTQACLIEPRDGFGHAGEQLEVLPAGDVLAFGQLAVKDAVAVEKGSAQDRAQSVAKLFAGCAVLDAVGCCVLIRAFWLGLHPAMIAIS